MFKSRGDIVYKCTVRLLEDTEILECEFHPSYKGKYLLEHVCQQLHLTETDYFGLRYVDSNGQRHWLHMAKLILKQVKDASPILFSFRVKFYPVCVGALQGGTRWQLYLQLRRDLLHARLAPTPQEAAHLAALIVQIELGDYDPALHVGNYVSELRLLLRQTDAVEARIQELHRTPAAGTAAAGPGILSGGGCGGGGVQGLSAEDAQRAFLKLATSLDTYGLDPHPVKDQRGTQVFVGVGAAGVVVLGGGRRLQHYRWADVTKINFEGRMFIVHLNYPEKKHTVGFKCPTGAACRHLWSCAIEQMLFFTLPSSSLAGVYSGGGLFSWGAKFKYVGRTERELLHPTQEETDSVTTDGKGARRKASSVPATPSTPMTNDFGYSSLPRSTHSAPLEEGGVAGAGCAEGGCLLAAGPGAAGAEGGCEPRGADDRASTTYIGLVSWSGGGGGGGGGGGTEEYNPRESFEHSSTESAAPNDDCNAHPQAHHPHSHPLSQSGPCERGFSWVRALLPALAISLAALCALAVLVLEGHGHGVGEGALAALRRHPDVRAIHHLYYTPLKRYLRKKLIDLF